MLVWPSALALPYRGQTEHRLRCTSATTHAVIRHLPPGFAMPLHVGHFLVKQFFAGSSTGIFLQKLVDFASSCNSCVGVCPRGFCLQICSVCISMHRSIYYSYMFATKTPEELTHTKHSMLVSESQPPKGWSHLKEVCSFPQRLDLPWIQGKQARASGTPNIGPNI